MTFLRFGKRNRLSTKISRLSVEKLEDRQLLACNPIVPGDVDGDCVFGTRDLVLVLQAGKYETGDDATFAEGDWNGDGIFNSLDFDKAFANFMAR